MHQGLEPPRGGLHLSISDHRRGGSRPVADRALIDGEAVVRQVDGRSDFEALMAKRGGAQASLVACRRLMTIPGVGQPTALAFVAAIDDPSPIRRSRNIGAYLGLVPRKYQSGEVDYIGGISKCGTGACEPSCTRPPTSC